MLFLLFLHFFVLFQYDLKVLQKVMSHPLVKFNLSLTIPLLDGGELDDAQDVLELDDQGRGEAVPKRYLHKDPTDLPVGELEREVGVVEQRFLQPHVKKVDLPGEDGGSQLLAINILDVLTQVAI